MVFSPPPPDRNDRTRDQTNADADVPFVGPNGLAPATAPKWAFAPTLYVWLFLLVLGFAAPSFLPSGRTKAVRETGVTAPDFQKYAAAETGAKSAFGIKTFASGAAGMSAQTLLAKSVRDYRDLLNANPSPNIARRILILEHSLQQPLDEKLLTGALTNALRRDKVSKTKQEDEISFWRGIYGDGVQSEAFAANGAAQIRAMNLRFWENRALADFYQAANQKTEAEQAESAFRKNAADFAAKELSLNGSVLLLFLAGIGFLTVFVAAACTKNWPLVRRVATENQPLNGGDLLDVFVFYLMCIFIARPTIGLLAPRFFPNPTLQTSLFLSAGVYVSTALFACIYLAGILKKRNAGWSAVYFRAPNGVIGNIGYGIAGFCATLPVSLALGSISRLIFQNNPNTTPNPIMPLIAGEHDPVSRIVIYLLAALAAPLFEELFFRGVLFSGLRTRFGWVISALISGACFALVHPMQDWLPIFGLGFMLGTMREMRQSLVPGIAAHFCQNTLTFLSMSLIFGD